MFSCIRQISQWVTDFANEQPLASEVVIGNSFDGNPIKAVKVHVLED